MGEVTRRSIAGQMKFGAAWACARNVGCAVIKCYPVQSWQGETLFHPAQIDRFAGRRKRLINALQSAPFRIMNRPRFDSTPRPN